MKVQENQGMQWKSKGKLRETTIIQGKAKAKQGKLKGSNGELKDLKLRKTREVKGKAKE